MVSPSLQANTALSLIVQTGQLYDESFTAFYWFDRVAMQCVRVCVCVCVTGSTPSGTSTPSGDQGNEHPDPHSGPGPGDLQLIGSGEYKLRRSRDT